MVAFSKRFSEATSPEIRRARRITLGSSMAFWLLAALLACASIPKWVVASEARAHEARAAVAARAVTSYLDDRLRVLRLLATVPSVARRQPLASEALRAFERTYPEFSRVHLAYRRPGSGRRHPIYLAAPLAGGGYVVGTLRRDWTERTLPLAGRFLQDADGDRVVLASRSGARTATSSALPDWSRLRLLVGNPPSVLDWGDGQPYLTAVASLGAGLSEPHPTLTIVSAIPMETIDAHIARRRAAILVLGVALGFATGFAGCVALGWALRRLRDANALLERRVAERTAELATAEGSFREIFEHVPLGLYHCDPEGRFLRVNPTLAQTLGYESPEALIASLGSLQALGDRESRGRFMERLGQAGEARESATPVDCVDGRTVWLAERARAVRGPSGEVLHIEGAMHDVTAQRELESQLRRMGETDPLTGLLNRRGLTQAIGMAAIPVSFVTLDVDRFKAYNDTYGHPAGDLALQAVAEAVRGNVRESDSAARAGGEEFVVVLPSTGAAGARRVAETLRAAVEASVGLEARLTVSVGVATATSVEEVGDAFAAADRALYMAKEAGRNRVVANPAKMA